MDLEFGGIVKKFYEGLAEGVIYGRQCDDCGAIECPPHYACNTCGYSKTHWVTLTGKGTLKSLLTVGPMDCRFALEDTGMTKYAVGEVELDEGPCLNALIVNISKKKIRETQPKLPVRVKPVFYDMGRFTTLYFELDED